MFRIGRFAVFSFAALALASAVSAVHAQAKFDCGTITTNDWNILIQDIKAKNPDSLKKLSDPATLKKQTESMRQLLAFACQARKDGLANEPANASELENIRLQTSAVEYDNFRNKPTNAAPFSQITDAQVAAFYKINGNDQKFHRFLDSKVELLQKASSNSQKVTPEEEEQARDYFARLSISDEAGRKSAAKLGQSYASRVKLQVRLQQAQFLARVYSDKLAPTIIATDAEIRQFIASHPELDKAKKKVVAQGILDRALAGEDFAELANKYTQDPGNKSANGELQGGLYANVPMGLMVKPFEEAALALEPGKISPQLVESDFGYHVIKLEKKTASTDPDGKSNVVYDVRHILISTTVQNPNNPTERELPIAEFAKQAVEEEKERAAVSKIVASNPIQMAELKLTAATSTAKRSLRRRNR